MIVRLRGAHNARSGDHPKGWATRTRRRAERGGRPPEKAALAVAWARAANGGRHPPEPEPPRGTRGKRRGVRRGWQPERATGRAAPVC